MRILKILGLVAVIPFVLLTARFLIHGNWNKTCTELIAADGSVAAVVHGYTDNPLTGWTTNLIWNQDDDRWLVYYLNHEAYFEKYELKKRGQIIEVFCNGSLIGQLDTAAVKFHHLRQKLLYEKPLSVIHKASMEDRQKWSYWQDSP